MALDAQTTAEIVRHRLGIPDASQNARITWAIPTALEQLARKVAANPRKRAMLLTDKSLTSIALVAGAADLAAYNAAATKKLLIEYLHVGNILYVGGDVSDAAVKKLPLHPVDPSQHLTNANHPLDGNYVFYWLDGQTLRTLDFAAVQLTGTLYFAVPYQPTLTHLAAIPELHGEFLEKMAELCAGPGNDTAEDGEH